MALSSLQAQLAALNSGGGTGSGRAGSGDHHPGSTFASSRRHDDGIVGRGLHYSANQGFALDSKSTKYKASIIYETAREAADVSLAVLRENALSSLEILTYELVPGIIWFTSSSNDASSSYLSITDDSKDLSQKQLQQVLLALSVLFHDTACQSDCLNVLEYLLRRYRLERQTPILLWVFWPHAEHHPTLFNRVLQLVDLTTDQSYVWLRPYCITPTQGKRKEEGEKEDTATTTKPSIPPRSLVAQHMTKNSSWLRRLVQSTQTIAMQRKWNSNSNALQRGIHHYASWSAALIVDGLSWIAATSTATKTTVDREAVVRILLPAILSACSSSSSSSSSSRGDSPTEDWPGWGCVMASTVAERMELAPATITLLVNKILQGISEIPSIDDQADAVTTVLSVLIPPPSRPRQPNINTYLPLLNGKWLGCPLSDDSFDSLLREFLRGSNISKSSSLSNVLGYLYLTRRIVVAPLVATLFVIAVRRCFCHTDSSMNMDDEEDNNNDTAHNNINCLKSLIQQESLLSMWKDTRMDLVASLASYVLLQGMKGTPEDTNQHNKILMALHTIDPPSCERGIAHTIQNNEMDESNFNRDSLLRLLKGVVDTNGDRMADPDDDNNMTHLLPPRVALEHADPAVRLEAIHRLQSTMHKTKSNGNDDDGDNDDDNSTDSDEEEAEGNIGESLLESLLRRWSTDDNVAVALAASKALCERLDRLLLDDTNCQRLGELVLSGLYRWMDEAALLQSTLSSEMQQMMTNSHIVAGYMARELGSEDEYNAKSLFQLIVEYLVMNLESDDELLALHAAESIVCALSESGDFKDKDSGEIASCARSLIVKNSKLLHAARGLHSKVVGPNPEAEKQIRRRCTWIILSEISRTLVAGKDAPAFSDDLLPLCLLMLHDKQSKLDDSGLEVIQKCLGCAATAYADYASCIPDLLVTLSETPSQSLYLNVIQPVTLSILTIPKDGHGNKVSATAVLLEAAARPDTPALSCERCLLLAAEIITSGDEVSPVLGLVPGLAFLEHPIGRVRTAALRLLQAVGDCLEHDNQEWSYLSVFCAKLKGAKSSSSMDANGLSKYLSSCVRDSKNGARGLLRMCLFTIASVSPTTTIDASSLFSKGWVPFGEATGGSRVAAVILDAMELAGEDSFPLKLRFEEAGKFFLEGCLAIGADAPPPLLGESVIRMLKGTEVQDPQIIISSGPKAGGGRTRTYSVGRHDGVTVIDPYPKDMVNCITKMLSQHNTSRCTERLASLVVKEILCSKSWCDLVFSKLSNKCRQSIASELLLYIDATTDIEDTDRAFSMLHLQPADYTVLLKENEENVPLLSILCDFIRANCSRIRVLPGDSDMVMELFSSLTTLSVESNSKDGVDAEKEYLTQSILTALSLLWKTGPDCCRIKLDKKKLRKCASILLGLFGDDNKPTSPYLKPFLSRSAALSLLSELCADCPELIMGSLVLAMKSSMPPANQNTFVPREVNETLSIVVSLFQVHGPSSGFPIGNLFQGFIESTQKYHELIASQLLHEFSRVLIAKYAGDDNSAGFSVASLMALSLAMAAHESGGNPVPTQVVRLVVHVVNTMPPSVQMSSLHMLLEYGKAIISTFLREPSQGPITSSADTNIFESLPCPKELSLMAATGALSNTTTTTAYTELQKHCIINFMNATLQAFCDILLIDKLHKYVNKGDAGSSALSLRVWQNLLVASTSIQHDLRMKSDDERTSSLVVAARLLKESQQMFAVLLPLHTFLASVSSLIKDNTADIIQESALQVVAAHAAEIDPNLPEAELFGELVPVISNLLEQKEVEFMADNASTVVHQASMLALAHISQATRKKDLALEHLSRVIKQCTKLLQKSLYSSDFKNIAPSVQQLICSIALCCAALVRTLGTRSMPSLPTLLKLLASSLGSVNDHVASRVVNSGLDKEAQVFQLSILRALVAIAEIVPQVLPPHLPLLFTERVVLSSSLQTNQSENSDEVMATSEELDRILSSKIPSRVLISAASRAADLCSSAAGLKALLLMMKTSIDQASSREAASHTDNLLKVVKKACEYEESNASSAVLLSASKHLLLSLVMKLSEAQLRQVFVVLQDWQGDVDTGNLNRLSTRRHAFWTLLAELSKELGTIFLPFLGTVMNDAKEDLDLAAVIFAELKPTQKTADGHKRRRLDNSNGTDVPCNETSLHCVKSLLLCLELSLRADARSGGNWVRSEENRWYDLLLDPLRKLLHCPVNEARHLIYETASGSGNVVSCLTALAAAAGNEQLWKPLNHAVLEACGDERHPGVRKAGILCLISLMESLGEEYMVLLPECLPVLSELLEDSEEDIASQARECVTLAEELIGESLEESLR